MLVYIPLIRIPFIIKMMNYYLIHSLHFKDGKMRATEGEEVHQRTLWQWAEFGTGIQTSDTYYYSRPLEKCPTFRNCVNFSRWPAYLQMHDSFHAFASLSGTHSYGFPAESFKMPVPQGDHVFFHLLSVTGNKRLLQSGNEAMGMFKWEEKNSPRASLTP